MSRIVARGASLWARGGAGVADQVTLAAVHFVVQVFAARSLGVKGYGAFAVAYAIAVFCQMVHGSLVAEPLIVFGAGLSRPRFRRHVGAFVNLHVRVVLANGLIVFLGAVWLSRITPYGTLSWAWSTGAIVVGLLSMQACRRALQASGRFVAAFLGTVAYATGILIGIALVAYYKSATPQIFFLVMAIPAACVALWEAMLLRPRVRRLGGVPTGAPLEEIRRYARWAAAGTSVTWLATNAPVVVLSALSGVSEAAMFRAAMNLFLPVQHILLGVVAVLLPALSRRASRKDWASVFNLGKRLAVIFSLGGLAYGGIIIVGANPIAIALYGREFDKVGNVIRLGGLLPALWGVLFMATTVLRALGRSDEVFRSNAGALLWVGGASMLIGATFGALGMIAALCALQAATIAWMIVKIKNIQNSTIQIVDAMAGSGDSKLE